jgi:hypothetical protein
LNLVEEKERDYLEELTEEVERIVKENDKNV